MWHEGRKEAHRRVIRRGMDEENKGESPFDCYSGVRQKQSKVTADREN